MTNCLTYLVTGGTGTLGAAVTRDILSQGHKVRVYARRVEGHQKLEATLPKADAPRVTTVIGSLHSWVTLSRASRGCDLLIHAAALKDIREAELHPAETVDTNVTGTLNVLQVCQERQIRRAVFVSTDKASAPTTLYGATKLLGERLWLGANAYSGGGAPELVAVRYGNVWGSNRSVLWKFHEQARSDGYLTLTDPRATRFHIRLEDAVKLVLKVLHEGPRGTLWVPKLETYSVGDLADVFTEKYGLEAPRMIGLRAAEKLHEDLISANETPQIIREDAGGYVLDPKYVGQPRPPYASGEMTRRLSKDQLLEEIERCPVPAA